MSSAAAVDNNAKSPLDAAQKIVAELKGMTPEHQSLALKFSMETLGLQLPTASAPAPTPPLQPSQTPAPPAASGAGHSTDIKSFTAMKAPKTDQQFAAVVAYFYQFEAPLNHRRESIDAATMKDSARLAVWKQAGDWNMTLNNALRSGYLDRADRGAFKLSSVGENLVAITLPGNGGSDQGNNRGFKKKTKKKAAIKKNSKKSG